MDVFNDASCRYYNGNFKWVIKFNKVANTIKLGCLIVEIHDHRSVDSENNNRTLETEAKMKRIVMKPTAESIWTDITLLSEEWGFPWTEDIALEVEAQILVSMNTAKTNYKIY
jgi:transcription factor SPT20